MALHPACKQENCDIARDGKCLESLETSACPHFYLKDDEDNGEDLNSGSASVTEEEKKEDNTVKILSGREMQISELKIVTHLCYSELVVFLGDHNCGKTTLLGTLFDILQTGSFKGYSFAGSFTLPGFEQRCHLARIASGRDSADTERTKSLQLHFLQLDIVQMDTAIKKHFIISDISGEAIKQARSSSRALKEYLGLAEFADHVFFILDGESLTPSTVHRTMHEFHLFVQNAISNGIFTTSTKLIVLISKWDIVAANKDFRLDAVVVEPSVARFKNSLNDLQFIKIASRPDIPTAEIPVGYGLDVILAEMFCPKGEVGKPDSPKNKQGLRFFDSFETRL